MCAALRPDRPIILGLEDEMVFYDLAMGVIFESLIKSIVRGHYHLEPLHVTLQINAAESLLFVIDERTTHLSENPALREWAMQFIAQDVFSIDPAAVDSIYLDGPANGAQTYLHIKGDGVFIACGEPSNGRGLYQ